MGIFNRLRARQYAMDWALKRNARFRDYSGDRGGGGDCTNFVSQAMLAGGWEVAWGNGRDNRAWWTTGEVSSSAWAGVQAFHAHVRVAGRASPCGRNELAWGDLMFVVNPGSDRPLHVMVVTDVVYRPKVHHRAENEVSLCGHSNDRLNLPVERVIHEYGESNIEFWKVADVMPARPQPVFNPGPAPPESLRRAV
jgi:hypothetical protein